MPPTCETGPHHINQSHRHGPWWTIGTEPLRSTIHRPSPCHSSRTAY
uniref:Uncharacterized protein n=1 Tax=Arundo donax TaxID=35708 RepID=A0A0A8ZTY9_ARUDO